MASTRKTNKQASIKADAIAKAEKKAAQRAKVTAPVKAVIAEEVQSAVAPVAEAAPVKTHYNGTVISYEELTSTLKALATLSDEELAGEIADTQAVEKNFIAGQPSLVHFIQNHKLITERKEALEAYSNDLGTGLDNVLMDGVLNGASVDWAIIGEEAEKLQQIRNDAAQKLKIEAAQEQSIKGLISLAQKPVWDKETFYAFMETYDDMKQNPEARKAFQLAVKKHDVELNGLSKFVDQSDHILKACDAIMEHGDQMNGFNDLGMALAESMQADEFNWQELADLSEAAQLENEIDLESEIELVSEAEELEAEKFEAAPQLLLGEAPAEEVVISKNSFSKQNVAAILTKLMTYGELTAELKAKPDSQTSKANLQATRQYVKQLMVDMRHPDVQKNNQYRAKKGEFNKYDAAKVKPKDLHKFYKGMISAIENGQDMNGEFLALSGKNVVAAANPKAFIDAEVVETNINQRLGARIVKMVTASGDFLKNNAKKIMVGAATIAVGFGLFTNSTSNSNKAVKPQDNKATKSNINVKMTAPAAVSPDKSVSYESAVKSAASIEKKTDISPVATVKHDQQKPRVSKPAVAVQEEVVLAVVDSSATNTVAAKEVILNTQQLKPISDNDALPVTAFLEATDTLKHHLPEISILAVKPVAAIDTMKVNSQEMTTEPAAKKKTAMGRFFHNVGEMFKDSFRGRTALEQEQDVQALRAQYPGPR